MFEFDGFFILFFGMIGLVDMSTEGTVEHWLDLRKLLKTITEHGSTQQNQNAVRGPNGPGRPRIQE